MPAEVDIDAIVTTSLSDIGQARTENQDACGEFRNDRGERLLIVADGMGGHQGGATASRICIEVVGRVFRDGDGPPDDRMRRGLEMANDEIRARASQDHALEGMGTTAVALLFVPGGKAWLAWIGDSRLYRFRQGQLEVLSRDHSVVAEWVRAGIISAEEALVHPRKNELLRAIGGDAVIQVDTLPIDVEPEDRYLLCSDGLWDYVADVDTGAVLGFQDPAPAAQGLVDRANAAGGLDNVTVQIAEIPRSTSDDTVPIILPSAVTAPPSTDPEGLAPGSRVALRRIAIAIAVVVATLAGAGYYAMTRGGGGLPLREAGEREFDPGDRHDRRTVVAWPDAEPPASEDAKTPRELETSGPASPGGAESAAEPESRISPPVAASELAVASGVEAASSDGAAPDVAAASAPPAVIDVASREPPHPGEPAAGASEPAAEGSAPSAGAAPAADSLDARVGAFLSAWTGAVETGNFDVYQSLGFARTRAEFEKSYGRSSRPQISFEVLERSPNVASRVQLRLRMKYSYWDGTRTHEVDKERRVELRLTGDGLRYERALD